MMESLSQHDVQSAGALMKIADVKARASVSTNFIYSKMRVGQFPKPVKIGARAVRWKESDIIRWINERETSK